MLLTGRRADWGCKSAELLQTNSLPRWIPKWCFTCGSELVKRPNRLQHHDPDMHLNHTHLPRFLDNREKHDRSCPLASASFFFSSSSALRLAASSARAFSASSFFFASSSFLASASCFFFSSSALRLAASSARAFSASSFFLASSSFLASASCLLLLLFCLSLGLRSAHRSTQCRGSLRRQDPTGIRKSHGWQ